jgi:hypothetical protein
MSNASWLATSLDQEMLEGHGVSIASRTTVDEDLPSKSGTQVSHELGSRYLLRYLAGHQTGLYTIGSDRRHFVTPTPYSAAETVSWLALPLPTQDRAFVLMLDPGKIATIIGPRWVRCGKGIEYILPFGFPKEALALAWEVQVG